MDKLLPQTLERTVLRVYDAIDKRNVCTAQHSEEFLWHELVSCILGSKVPFEHAQAASRFLVACHLLEINDCLRNGPVFECRLADALLQPISLISDSSVHFKYRYPRLRANHIRRTGESMYGNNGSISSRLASTKDSRLMRLVIMQHSVGIGPKQASLFLRNIGFTDTLAVLDTHVLRYMFILGLLQIRMQVISTISHYQEIEDRLRIYTRKLGLNMAYLDTAIWVTMRVYQREAA